MNDGRGPDGSQTSSGQGFSLVGLTLNCVINRSGIRTDEGAGEGEVEFGFKGALAGEIILFILPEQVEK